MWEAWEWGRRGASSLPTGIGAYPHTQVFFQERKKEVRLYKVRCLATRFTEPDNGCLS